MDRNLKWWFAMPQILLRRPRRGGKAGNGLIKKRFDCIAEDDYSKLIDLWLEDKTLNGSKLMSKIERNNENEEVTLKKKSRQAVSLISKGFISKASNRMTSHGVASLSDPITKAALSSKYPKRCLPIPQRVEKTSPIESLSGLRDALINLKRGVAPGSGQFRPEFLITLAEVFQPGDPFWRCFQDFGMMHLNGELPPWYYRACMTVETVGLFKTSDRDPSIIRPVGMRNPWVKTLHKEVIRQNKDVILEFLEPQQLGMSIASAAKLIHKVRSVMESNPKFICVKLDFRNAFNEVSRSRILEALQKEENLRHLVAHAATVLAPCNGLESGGVLWGECEEGTTQGDPESGPFFCIAIHEFVRNADFELSKSGGSVCFGWDDGYLMGLPSLVFEVLEKFISDMSTKCGLTLQRSKTEVYSPNFVPEIPSEFNHAGLMINEVWNAGMICYGIPIGSDSYVKHMLSKKVDEISNQAECISTILEEEKQSLWTILRSSLAQKLEFWLSLCYPTQVRDAAEKMDRLNLSILCILADSKIPMSIEEGSKVNFRAPIEALNGRSFQHLLIRQPIKMGGMGIRSNVEVSPVAFLSGIQHAKEFMIENNTTFSARTQNEMNDSWNLLKYEIGQYTSSLALEAPERYKISDFREVNCANLRKEFSEHREIFRNMLINEDLSRNNIESDIHLRRTAISWKNRDKLSSAWLGCLPGPEGLTSREFSEAFCLNLCIPSPSTVDKIGCKIGKSIVDEYGDKITTEILPGDHFRTRHDQIKMVINSLLTWSRIPTTCEVWGLFAHLFPNKALSKIDSHKKRQGLVPDFKLDLPNDSGIVMPQLAELKVISCSESWYKFQSSSSIRGTDRRSQILQTEYKRKARDLDQTIMKVSQDMKGPVEKRLDEYGDVIGLCFGNWGEGSEGVHRIIQMMAESRLKFQGMKNGRPGSRMELGLLIGQIRRRLSIATIKAQVSLLLARQHHIGPGNALLAKKREWALEEDSKMRQERRAQWNRKYDGIQSLRKGFFIG